MIDGTLIIPFHPSDSVADPLIEIARDGARHMLAEALRAKADACVASLAGETLPDGRRRVVRHGHGPERALQTGIGALDVQRPNMRDRAGEDRVRFTSSILPARAPVPCLRGISTGDFQEAPSALPGPEAANPSSESGHAADRGLAGYLRRMAAA